MNHELRIKNKPKIIPCFMLLASCFLLIVPAALAQSVDLGIYPPVFQIEASSPTNISAPFYIQNFSDESVDLNISFKPFIASNKDDGNVSYPDSAISATKSQLANVRVIDNGFPINALTLSPKQKKDLILQIEVPQNQLEQDYYFSLIFASLSNKTSKTTSSQISAGVASNILLSVNRSGKPDGYIKNFSTAQFINKGPVTFNLKVSNSGKHFITPSGNILIKNMFNQTIGKVNLLPVNILANSTRAIPNSLQSTTTAIWPESFLLGPYTATLNVSLSDSGPVFVRQIVFFAFPMEYAIGTLFAILIIIYIAYRIKKARNDNLN